MGVGLDEVGVWGGLRGMGKGSGWRQPPHICPGPSGGVGAQLPAQKTKKITKAAQADEVD